MIKIFLKKNWIIGYGEMFEVEKESNKKQMAIKIIKISKKRIWKWWI
jgi:hypothetical protein